LTEGALFAGLAVVLALIGFYIPVVGIFVSLLWPVPIALMVLRHGLRTAVMTVFVAGAVLSMVVGILEGTVMTLTMGIVGLAMGYAISRGWSAFRTLAIASFAVLIGLAVSVGASVAFLRINVLDLLAPDLSEAAKSVSELYAKFGVPKDQTDQILKMLVPPRELLLATLPATLFMAVVINALINYEVARRIMPRFGYQVTGLPAFREWRFPKIFAFLYIVAQSVVVVKNMPPFVVAGRTISLAYESQTLYNAATNLTIPLMLCILIQGLSIGYFFLNRWKVGKALANMLIAFVLFNPSLWQMAFMFGLMDNLIDYRRAMAMLQQK
jgi:uncharacterized protein YybS (DUF2232 family)